MHTNLATFTTATAIALLSSVSFGSRISAQTPELKIPTAIVLPWTEIGINREAVELSRKSTEAARNSLIAIAIPAGQKLATLAPATLLPTLKQFAEQVFVGDGASPQGPITYAPVWCAVGDSYIFNLLALDTLKTTILAHSSYRIKKTSWEKQSTPEKLNPIASTALQKLYANIQSKLATASNAKQASDALHVGLSLVRETTRADVGSSLCINVMVSGKLAQDYTIVSPVAGEFMASLRHALKIPPNLRRPTRNILTRWEFPANRTQAIQFPLLLKLHSQYSETVLGQIIGTAEESTWTFFADDQGTVNVGLDAALVEFLNGEKRALNLADSPQSSKVYGAWVYLDRGRAYGLHMDDRLVGKSADGKEITGHVVGFFGPEKKIKSPRGHLIHEGAIMFVRKGQQSAKLGQNYTFDPKIYPLLAGSR